MKFRSFSSYRFSLPNLALGVTAIGAFTLVMVLSLREGELPEENGQAPDQDPAFGGQAGFAGPGFPGPGGRGGRSREPVKLLDQFDENDDGYLDRVERTSALAHLESQDGSDAGGGRRPRGGGFRGGPRGGGAAGQDEPQPGPSLTPAEVTMHPDAPLYDPFTLRTLFLEFEGADWEKELESFKDTDVDVAATLKVDGETLHHVGVRFRGNTSYSSVGTGRKRPLNLTLDMVHPKQDIDGYGTLNLLNANGDPTIMRSVLFYEIARQYIPAFKANFVRLVINGESWGIYANVQQYDSKFTKDFFGTPKGARWKVPGNPRGQGGLTYFGDDIDSYRPIYDLKSREDPKSWVGLMLLSQTLNNTPPELLESALEQTLDVDGVLRFLALDNALVNNDGFWVRASDYSLYRDPRGQFHVLPYDANETFAVGRGGGPGLGGPPDGGGRQVGGRGGRGFGGRGRGGPGGFGPGAFLAPGLIERADENRNGSIERDEWVALADAWFQDASVDKADTLDRDRFIASLTQWVESGGQPPQRRGGFSPIEFMGGDLFRSIDGDENGQVSHSELRTALGDWFTQWDTEQSGALAEVQFTSGINETLTSLRAQNGGAFAQAGPRGGRGGAGGPGGFRGRGGPGGGPGGGPEGRPGGGGVDLDPLVLENDESRPLASKLLAVPELRARYLSYVRDIAENWLDWEKVGPRISQYRALIEEDVTVDTRKLFSVEEFYAGIDNGGEAEERSLRGFFDRRRAFLLAHEEVKAAKIIDP